MVKLKNTVNKFKGLFRAVRRIIETIFLGDNFSSIINLKNVNNFRPGFLPGTYLQKR